ncbi:MAG TPA: hypothetical protein VJ890_26615 [Vineibacter sp.]|nr:hypothetical protein [Vineibacter sp.]
MSTETGMTIATALISPLMEGHLVQVLHELDAGLVWRVREEGRRSDGPAP